MSSEEFNVRPKHIVIRERLQERTKIDHVVPYVDSFGDRIPAIDNLEFQNNRPCFNRSSSFNRGNSPFFLHFQGKFSILSAFSVDKSGKDGDYIAIRSTFEKTSLDGSVSGAPCRLHINHDFKYKIHQFEYRIHQL